jgi:hypothetical protein
MGAFVWVHEPRMIGSYIIARRAWPIVPAKMLAISGRPGAFVER